MKTVFGDRPLDQAIYVQNKPGIKNSTKVILTLVVAGAITGFLANHLYKKNKQLKEELEKLKSENKKSLISFSDL